LREQLVQTGFTITSDARKADIIIAHSAGCYLVPIDHQARVVINIGYTYWPGRRLLASLIAKLAEEYHRIGALKWLKESAIHDIYALNLLHVARLVKGWKAPGAYLQKIHGNNIFIRNQDDPYCEPTAVMEAAGDQHMYISMYGYHDHVWDEPEPYINLLKSVS
jgi:hypothetical protein